MKKEWYKGYSVRVSPSYESHAQAMVFWNEGNTIQQQLLLLPTHRTFQTQEQAEDLALGMTRAWIDGRIILAESRPASI